MRKITLTVVGFSENAVLAVHRVELVTKCSLTNDVQSASTEPFAHIAYTFIARLLDPGLVSLESSNHLGHVLLHDGHHRFELSEREARSHHLIKDCRDEAMIVSSMLFVNHDRDTHSSLTAVLFTGVNDQSLADKEASGCNCELGPAKGEL